MARDALRGLGDLCRRVFVKHLNMTPIASPVECLLVNELDYSGASFVFDRRNFGEQFGRFPEIPSVKHEASTAEGSRLTHRYAARLWHEMHCVALGTFAAGFSLSTST